MTKYRVVLNCLLLILLGLHFPSPSPGMETAYLTTLIQEARKKRLWERRQWQILLHYKPRLLRPGVKSQVDSESFFLAPNGKTDPQSELEATLSSFFSPHVESDEEIHPQCAFIARYHWLKQELNFNPEFLHEHSCPRFHDWIARLNPDHITFVFPVAFLNNPASMFGHTLLRIDSAAQDKDSRLLAHTISFAAHTEHERGLGFALKGLFGGYPGRFFNAPYYMRVKEYGDIENRDIWEYRLNLESTEIRRLLMHLWELQSVHFDYFFLDENCSYQLLSLLEAARPSAHLTDRFALWAIPSDTIRTVTEVPGLLKEAHFRPARRTVLQERLLYMGNELQGISKGLGEGKISVDEEVFQSLSPLDQARTLELAVDYAEYRKANEKGISKAESFSLMPLLEARSHLDVPSQVPRVNTPRVRPDKGHKSSRFGIGYGYEDSLHFFQLDVRPAYHDLLDPPGGFIRGAELEFLYSEVRYWPRKNRVSLERLCLINILSVPPRDRFIKPFSWKVNAGLARERFSSNDRPLTGQFNAGVGVGYELPFKTLIYTFAEGKAVVSDRFDDKLALGAGPSLGILLGIAEKWRTGFSSHLHSFALGATGDKYDISLTQSWIISAQSALRLKFSRKREFSSADNSVVLSWQVYL